MKKKKHKLPLDKFINYCLYDKKNGYYMKKNPFGKTGDFTTAPNISRLFSEMIAIWIICFLRSTWFILGPWKSRNWKFAPLCRETATFAENVRFMQGGSPAAGRGMLPRGGPKNHWIFDVFRKLFVHFRSVSSRPKFSKIRIKNTIPRPAKTRTKKASENPK